MIIAYDEHLLSGRPRDAAMIAMELPQFSYLTPAAVRSYFVERAHLYDERGGERTRSTADFAVEYVWRRWVGYWQGKENRPVSYERYNHPKVCDCPSASFGHLASGCPYDMLRWRNVQEILRMARTVGWRCGGCGELFHHLEETDQVAQTGNMGFYTRPHCPVRYRLKTCVFAKVRSRGWTMIYGLPEFCDDCITLLDLPKVKLYGYGPEATWLVVERAIASLEGTRRKVG